MRPPAGVGRLDVHRMTRLVILTLLIVGGFAAFLAVRCDAASTRMFPFVIPWNDATPHTPTDVSFLNHPIEPIVARSGHFYGKTTGRRIRFIGASFVAEAAFPTHADAEAVAAHLAKYGINIVRLHHMDNAWYDPHGSLIDTHYPDHRHIDPDTLDRLDYFVAQLEKHGIYVDLNLHVSRQFTAADGFPASVEQIPFAYDKRVDQFDATMIDLQKEYAHDMLTHVNPYTHLTFANDPGVALIEINNENSLVGDPWSGLGAGLDNLPQPFSGELAGLWDKWLTARYGSDEKLTAAWQKGVTPTGPSIVNASSAWLLEQNGGQGTVTSSGGSPTTAPDASVDVTQVDGVDWHVQSKVTGLAFHDGDGYTVTFRARSDSERQVSVTAMLDAPDWHNIGLQKSADVGTDWRTFRYPFVVSGAGSLVCRVTFAFGTATGHVDIAGLSVTPGMPGAGLAAGQTLTAGNVAIPVVDSATPGQRSDWITFLADTERAYADTMRDYIRGDLGAKACIVESQVGFGGLTSVYREAGSDYADNHAYWEHPSFPHKQWDAVDWFIDNHSMIPAVSAGQGTLIGLAEYRVDGKPYSVSEYNHPAPSDYQAETVPLIFTFAAAQDWDAVFLYDYGDYGEGVDTTKVDGYFGIGANPAKMAFIPAAAMLFRGGLMPPFAVKRVAALTPEESITNASTSALWPTAPNALQDRLALAPTGAAASDSAPREETSRAHTPSGTQTALDIQTIAGDQVYTASSPASQAVAGVVGGHTVTLGPASYEFPSFGDNYAALVLVAMDSHPLEKSANLLLTIVGRVENQEMTWNSARTSVGNGWGHGPVQAEAIPATISLHVIGPRTVRALSPTGSVLAVVPSTYQNGILQFTTGDADTIWYAISSD